MPIHTRPEAARKARLFQGLSDPSRLAILEVLCSGPLSVSALVEKTGLSQPNVSNHLASLRDGGLVTAQQQGRYICYRVSDERIAYLLGVAEELLTERIQSLYEQTRTEGLQKRDKEPTMDEQHEPDSENLEHYLHQIQQIPPLTTEQERQLVQQMEQGRNAQKQLVEAHRHLVVSIARQYEHHGIPLLDLIQAGNTGLSRAVEDFDATKTSAFSTYATWRVRQAITQTIADSR